MSVAALLLLALGVSADAFAVAVGTGLRLRRPSLRVAATVALAFGLAQALMPLLGWLLGSQVAPLVQAFDHWVAFALLALVGGSLLRDAAAGGADEGAPVRRGLGARELAVLSVATSIDALAVGIGLALVDVSIVAAVVLFGVVTCVLSFAGVALGQHAGARLRRPAEAVGGLVLIGIGVQILVEHLGLL